MQNQFSRKLTVGLGERSYPIYIGSGIQSIIEETYSGYIDNGQKVVLLIDEGFYKASSKMDWGFINMFPHLILPSGETTKSIEFLSKAWSFLAEEGIDRTGVLFAIGGGVTGDLAGFAAASYLRGVDFFQVPTTLLAMVDSSVGGKTGINLKAGKNLVGAFHQPQTVFIDLDCLKTLPEREFSAGMAEVIKYGLLGNQKLFERLINLSEPLCPRSPELAEIIEICCSDKANVVEADERESINSSGGRALLNLGHTFAHAIEAVAGYGQYLHGEAVSIGLVAALRLSKSSGFSFGDAEENLSKLLKSYSLPTELKSPLDISLLIEAMRADKKVSSGNLRFVVLKEIGDAFVSADIDMDDVTEVWRSVGGS